MRHRLLSTFIVLFVCTVIADAQEVRYSVPEGSWEESFGNHRALIQVDQPEDAVHIKFLWRRHDLSPEKRTAFAGKYLSPEPYPEQAWVSRHSLTDKEGRYKGVAKGLEKDLTMRLCRSTSGSSN